jgi:Zn-dependent M28 family amino/carboxypeptidase
MIKDSFFALSCVMFVGLTSCGGTKSKTAETDKSVYTVKVPEFNTDSAYAFVKAQVDFGPRTSNSSAHQKCGKYLVNKLKNFGAKVTEQSCDLSGYDGTILKSINIIGSYKPESKKRIVLFSHWDSRPWADNDPDKNNWHKPILAANDGASGVGVLLEIARLIQKQQPEMGIDIIFLDAEDYGTPQFYKGQNDENSWGLGAQYWARNPHVENYNARFGILLDMVGGKGATFFKEQNSEQYASSVNKKLWHAANALGFSQYFVDKKGGAVTDDHTFINQIAGIPTADIIPDDENCKASSFGPTWHTLADNMSNIDKATLKAVGQTVLQVIYNEK